MPGELGSSGHAPAGRSRIVEPCKVAFGSKQLALGLLWQPVKQGLALRAQARMAGGGKGGFDLHARPAGNRQIGFARTQDELTPGMLAGATAVNAVGWGDNWLAAMKLPGSRGLWWIVAMRDSLIYEDQLHAAESAALAAFRRSLEAPHWEKVVAPPCLGSSRIGSGRVRRDSCPQLRGAAPTRQPFAGNVDLGVCGGAPCGGSNLWLVRMVETQGIPGSAPANRQFGCCLASCSTMGGCAVSACVRARLRNKDEQAADHAVRLACRCLDVFLGRVVG